MIVSFADRETEAFWHAGKHRKLPPDVQPRAFRKLQLLDAAATLDFLRVTPWEYAGKTVRRPAGAIQHPRQSTLARLLPDEWSGTAGLFCLEERQLSPG